MIYGKYKVWVDGDENNAEFYRIDSPRHAAAKFLDERLTFSANVTVLDKVTQERFCFSYERPPTYGALKEIL